MSQHLDRNTHLDWPAIFAEQSRANLALFYSLAYKILRDRCTAQDACQNALLSAWVRRNDILNIDRLKAWLATAVINESLAVLRRRRVEKKVLNLVSGHGGATTSDASLDTVLRREAIVLALADLEENERAAVTLRVMQGLSGREVAIVLGISEGQVSKLLHRGMECLRISLANWNDV